MMGRRAWRLAPLLLLGAAFALAGALLLPGGGTGPDGTGPGPRPAYADTANNVTGVAITSFPANGADYRFGAVV